MSTILDRFRGRGYVEPWRRLAYSLRVPQADGVPLQQRLQLTRQLAPITWRLFPKHLPPHNDREVGVFIDAVLERRGVPGLMVEAGSFKGVSAAKFSHVAAMTGRELVIFDSFEGLPRNEEVHLRSTKGFSIEGWFEGGKYVGSLEEVKANVSRFGRPEVVRYVKGWFDDTMPRFNEAIAAAYIDVDLASSTRTCLRYLWPLISSGGVAVSQDGDFQLVVDVLTDSRFWEDEVGVPKPPMDGLGTKMVVMYKEN